ncbi:SDR family oxidoreductase [Novosphingobium arvoryzae]|uniref:Short-chain dehydrogenase n=1 Tax=Novosphingobium arvoryzae TaxID=1256514 RepID=A0A918RPK2_9SPHN|nr:SDR family oxidoreductase [Novosphingobium arvoryzae]GHA05313.1 short-chain dehydrogenase [Novosphingobium arvoryzae]
MTDRYKGIRPAPPRGTRMLPEGTFTNDVAVITGGGSGLGKAIAAEFGRLGGAVAIASRDPDKRARGVEAVEAAGGRAIGVQLDVRDPEAVKACFDEVEDAFGPITQLVNNAAGNLAGASEDFSLNAWRAVTGIVLDGTWICSTEFARRRIADGIGGSILNIGATYSWTGGPGTSPSAAAKAAVTNLTQTHAVEWAPYDIRVNCLVPGLFPHEDRAAHLRFADANNLDNRQPALRVGQTHELGWAAAYLCSDYAAFCSGHAFVLDGANWLRRSLRMPEFQPVREWLPKREK